jgi:hypothetical protein
VNAFEIEMEMRVISRNLVKSSQHPIICLLILITTFCIPSPSRAVSRDGGISLLWNAQSNCIPSRFIVASGAVSRLELQQRKLQREVYGRSTPKYTGLQVS